MPPAHPGAAGRQPAPQPGPRGTELWAQALAPSGAGSFLERLRSVPNQALCGPVRCRAPACPRAGQGPRRLRESAAGSQKETGALTQRKPLSVQGRGSAHRYSETAQKPAGKRHTQHRSQDLPSASAGHAETGPPGPPTPLGKAPGRQTFPGTRVTQNFPWGGRQRTRCSPSPTWRRAGT